VSAKVEHDDYSGSLRGSAVEILTLAEARLRYAKGVLITLPTSATVNFQDSLSEVKTAVGEFLGEGARSGSPIFLDVQDECGACRIELGKGYRIQPSPEQLDLFRKRLKLGLNCFPEGIEVIYSS